eukprot:SAG31_NODE_2139_length_6349_cov_2.773636_12_plen_105_part_00
MRKGRLVGTTGILQIARDNVAVIATEHPLKLPNRPGKEKGWDGAENLGQQGQMYAEDDDDVAGRLGAKQSEQQDVEDHDECDAKVQHTVQHQQLGPDQQATLSR